MNAHTKIATILDLCRDRRVLDIGCCDRGAGVWLHGEIERVAARCYGVDTNYDVLEQLKLQGHDVGWVNIESHYTIPYVPFTPDVIVLGDVIEHLNAPGQALANIRSQMAPDACLIITTPNAFWWRRFIWALFRREVVHPEHTCWYSLQTLRQLLHRHGFSIVEDNLTAPRRWHVTGPFSLLDELIVSLSRRLCERLIVIAEVA